MSDSLMAFQPAIDDPSNMKPSANVSSLIVSICCVTLQFAAWVGKT